MKLKYFKLFGLLFIALLALAIFLFWLYGSNSAKHNQVLENLRQLKQEEAGFNEDILKLRYGFLDYYDSLPAHLEHMKKLFLAMKERSASSEDMVSYEGLLQHRRDLMEEFTTENSTYNNSLHYFPNLMVQLSNDLENEGNASLLETVEVLLRNVLLYNATGDTRYEAPIKGGTETLRHERMQFTGKLKDKLGVAAQHAEILLQGRNKVNDLVTQLLAVPMSATMERISYQVYEAENKKSLRLNQWVGFIFNGFCVAIIGYMFFMFSRLGRTTAELEKVNASLKSGIEDRQRLEKMLVQGEKMAAVGQLAAGVAHEINNPVGFISNNMELLGQYVSEYTKILRMVEGLKKSVEEDDLAKAKNIIKDIRKFEEEIQLDLVINETDNLLKHNQRGIERIQKIVMDLKTFAREDNDMMELIKVEEVIDSILSIVQSELKYKADLKKNYGETPLLKCNPQRLGQVFINLFVNAAQSMVEKGTIEVKTYQEGKFLCITVSDTGKGIAPENLTKIFDAFFTTKPVGQGTGLGLSVSYEIVKKHGGDIKVTSKVGEGTTFTVMLPLEQT